MAHWIVGIDIGGTFTDLVALHLARGEQRSLKVLTTHGDPTEGVVRGTAQLMAEHGIAPADVARVVHATTLFTNALIERRGACTGLLATAGFGDIVEMGNERKFDLYDLRIERVQPLAPRHLRAEAAGRMDAQGRELQPLDVPQALREVARLVDAGVESLAVCLLHAWRNDAHERQLAAAIAQAHPTLTLTLSCDTAPVIREYERLTTTLANAYIKPMARHYLDRLARQLGALGLPGDVLMMLSNGGLAHLDEARSLPIALLESGPAAGAISAAHHSQREGRSDLLAFDMGGTTAKLCLVNDARPSITFGFEAARQKRFAEGSGMPIGITTVDLIEIGAGGGSIASRDALGLLKVGPRSAGSQPGPMCYGQGGAAPTVTDANLLLGYLNPDFFAGGSLQIQPALARRGFEQLGEALGHTAEEAAWGVHDIVAENMAAAARVHVAERGQDPRRFVLVATGGGGPLHAYHVARKIGVSTIICPPQAGVASAFGLLVAQARADRSRSFAFQPARDDVAALEQLFTALEHDVRRPLQALESDFGPIRLRRRADGRFIGQGFSLGVDLPDGPYATLDTAQADRWRGQLDAAFREAYADKFGRTPPDVPVELVSLQVTGEAPPLRRFEAPVASVVDAPAVPSGRRPVYFAERQGFVDTPVYQRAQLRPGVRVAGPALVEEDTTTVVVGPLAHAVVTAQSNLVIQIEERSA